MTATYTPRCWICGKSEREGARVQAHRIGSRIFDECEECTRTLSPQQDPPEAP